MKTEFTITKEQIKDLASQWEENEITLKEWFPEAFKKELEVGKWYNYNGCLLNYVKEGKGVIKAYGFFHGEFDENHCNCETSYDEWKEATSQEVETALIAEAVKKGFKKGSKVIRTQEMLNLHESPHAKKKCFISTNEFVFDIDENYLSIDGRVIFIKGIWAEIVKEPDYETEIESIQQKAKTVGMKAVITFEKL